MGRVGVDQLRRSWSTALAASMRTKVLVHSNWTTSYWRAIRLGASMLALRARKRPRRFPSGLQCSGFCDVDAAGAQRDKYEAVRFALRPSLDVSDIVFDRIIDQSKISDPMRFARIEGNAIETVDGASIALD